MDAITLLRDDHKTVEQLFKRFEKAGDEAYVEKRQIVDRIIEELSVHAAIEEQVFYPVARATVPDTEDIALESLEEHHIVKWVLSELDGMDPASERFDAKVTVLIENVRHHVDEEETEFFPKVRNELGRKALAELGEAMDDAKRSAPTHPHPRSPDAPPGERGRRRNRRRRRPGRRQHQRHRPRRRQRPSGSHRPDHGKRSAEGVTNRLDRRQEAGQECPQRCRDRRGRRGGNGAQHPVRHQRGGPDGFVGSQGDGHYREEVRQRDEDNGQAGRHDDRADCPLRLEALGVDSEAGGVEDCRRGDQVALGSPPCRPRRLS